MTESNTSNNQPTGVENPPAQASTAQTLQREIGSEPFAFIAAHQSGRVSRMISMFAVPNTEGKEGI